MTKFLICRSSDGCKSITQWRDVTDAFSKMTFHICDSAIEIIERQCMFKGNKPLLIFLFLLPIWFKTIALKALDHLICGRILLRIYSVVNYRLQTGIREFFFSRVIRDRIINTTFNISVDCDKVLL
jgi:hypothetical protein